MSRNIRNIIYSLEIGGENYESLVKKASDEFKLTIKYECKECQTKFDLKKELIDHDCQKINVSCKKCEHDSIWESFESHPCRQNVLDDLIAIREEEGQAIEKNAKYLAKLKLLETDFP